MIVESIASAVHDGNILGGLFLAGLLISLVGLPILGITAMITGHRRWAAMLPILSLFVGIAGGDPGNSIITAAVWIVIGAVLLRTAS